MKAVILAGGVRSGLELAGAALPRALWPLPGEPVITGVIRYLLSQGIQEIAICANGKTPLIAAKLQATGEDFLKNLHFSEDRFPRGPAGCLKDLQLWLGHEDFVVIQGTGMYAFSLQAMHQQHVKTKAAITVAAMPSNVADDKGGLEPAGVFLMSPCVLDHIQTVGYQDIKEQLLPKLRTAGQRVICHEIDGTVKLIHGPEHYLQALPEAIAQAGAAQAAPVDNAAANAMVEQQPGLFVHAAAKVSPSVRCAGNVWIEAGAVIDENAVIVGPVVIGANVRVGRDVLLSRAVIMEECMISDGAEVVDSVVAPNTRVFQPAATKAKGTTTKGEENATASVFTKARKALEGWYGVRRQPTVRA